MTDGRATTMKTNRWGWVLRAIAALSLCAVSSQGAAAASCADVCQLGAVSDQASCQLWDTDTRTWIDPVDDGPGQLHNRARVYLPWLREKMMPAGGVMSTVFTDTTFETVSLYAGRRDPAIWTGSYLAAEALRFMSTGAYDAYTQIAETLQVLHRWWNIPGDAGYLARFAATTDSDPAVLATLPAEDEEVHVGTEYEGETWNWRGNVSRDQYQGVLLGYSLAYEAISDPGLRALIREDLVEFAEQLMQRETREVEIVIGGSTSTVDIELENVVYIESEMPNGKPRLEIDLASGEVRGYGMLPFWPRPTDYIRQVPGFGWVPEIKTPTQAIQLGAAFRAALQVAADAPEYAARYADLAEYYDGKFADWFELASDWRKRQDCGDSYHGINIAFMPAYTWARLETDAVRRAQIRRDVLQARMWPAVEDDKNVFFAFLYASQAPAGTDLTAMIDFHVDQLAGFRTAPNQAVPVDVRDLYPEDPSCPDQSAIAIDVSQRVPASFIWERKPYNWYDAGHEQRLFGGVDYLLAYWLGRYYRYIEDDAPQTCLAWTSAPPGAARPEASANGEDGVVTVRAGEMLTVDVELDVDSALLGHNGDWWVAATLGPVWYGYDFLTGLWTAWGVDPSVVPPTHQGPLVNLPAYPVVHTRFLPAGSYVVYFAVDGVMNGKVDPDQLYFDAVTVVIE
jgi:hypothetical protein